MTILWTIAEQVMRQQLSGAASPFALSSVPRMRFGMYAVAGFITALGVIFSFVAAYLWLLTVYSPPLAAMATAGLAFLLAGVLVGLSLALRTMRRAKRRKAQVDNMAMMNSAMAMIAEELEEPVKAYPKTAIALATLAGIVAGDKLH
jgi:hypothetical protein